MSLFGRRPNAVPLLLALILVGVPAALGAEEPPAPKDEALDRLLEKLDGSSAAPKAKSDTPDAKAGAESDKDKDKAKAQDKDQKQAQEKEKADATKAQGKTEGDKAKGDVAPKDQALDNLLEKLGESKDRPDAQDERRGGRPMPGEGEDKDKDKDKGPGNEPRPPKAEQPDPGDLNGKDKTIDERLEELTGRKRKKKQDQGEDDSGPLSQVIKEMRDVEQRLGKTDVGEETRKKQIEIVKNIDQLIEQLRNSSSQSQGKKQIRSVSEAGQKPGQNPGQTPGANAGGAPNQKPAKPENKHAKVGSKDEWGHLPPELQQERASAADEEMLTAKQELIRLYYLSVSKKSLSR